MDIRHQLNELFGRKQKKPESSLDPSVKNLTANRLPPDLKRFILIKSGKKSVRQLDELHKHSCWYIEDFDLSNQVKMNIDIVNDKRLYMIYDPTDYRLKNTVWFSFKDKNIYRYITYEFVGKGYGFYKTDGKTILKPIPYKVWMKKFKG